MRLQTYVSFAVLTFTVVAAVAMANDLIPAPGPTVALGPNRKLGGIIFWWDPFWCDPFWCDGAATFMSVVATVLIIIGLIWCINYHYRRHRWYFRRHGLLGKRATIENLEGESDGESTQGHPSSFDFSWTDKFTPCFTEDDISDLSRLLPHLNDGFLKRIGLNMLTNENLLVTTAQSVRKHHSPIDPTLALNFANSHQAMAKCIALRLVS